MRVVGRGAFGKVRIVERRDTRVLYALKYISKHDCIQMDAVRNVVRERVMLEQLDHPFICRLRFAFQDDEYMYMVMDLMMGGNLGFHLLRQKFDENVIRFWIAELACAINYLHQERVVHRDIKPDNILLDEDGHVHLSDFNIASHLPSHRPLTSQSGTALYMAPEIYRGGGYNEAVDWWGLGVTMYECVYRKRPFDFEKSEELQKAILRGHVHYPQNVPFSVECVSVIQGLLDPNPSKRLGYGPSGWAALVHHPFFRSIDWNRLKDKSINPLFRPPSNQNNFDATHDLEELLFEDNPLSGQPRKNTRRHHAKSSSGMSKEMEKYEREMDFIEERFKPFDFTVFERYEGFQDPVRMTVGEPPEWVKPAFEGAEHGDFLPVKRISTTRQMESEEAFIGPPPAVPPAIYADRQWRENNRARPSYIGPLDNSNQDSEQRQPYSGRSVDANGGLTEDYAYYPTRELQKKQSNRSFRERRERDRRSVSRANNDTRASSSTAAAAIETLADKLKEM
ncbi:kinase-like domain-containing protein [Umbelopsis sp. PMI_123]|nr:kinase-like domain-containing protein [Umbelopsis sp. PMI_123]